MPDVPFHPTASRALAVMNINANFIEQAKVIMALFDITPSASVPSRVSLKGYERATFLVYAKNATTVTGSAITLKQSKTVAGGSEKPVTFTKAWRNIDLAAGQELAEFAVTSNTFTTDNTNSKNLLYVIEVTPDMLDADGGFDVVGVGTADATATAVTVIGILWPARYGAAPSAMVNPLAN